MNSSHQEQMQRVVPPPPDEDADVWRYVDLAKFLHLLETRMLFFPRASILDDPHEGAFPAHQGVEDRLRAMIGPQNLPPGAIVSLSPGLAESWKWMRDFTMVSCWHLSPHESDAMWKLYSRAGASVAIQSNVRALRAALGSTPPSAPGEGGSDRFHIGVVEYIDYGSDRIPDGSFAAQFFRKRRAFEHERELRVLFSRYPGTSEQRLNFDAKPQDGGVSVPVDLGTLVRGLRVAPGADAWFLDLLERVCRRYGLPVTPTRSQLDAKPSF